MADQDTTATNNAAQGAAAGSVAGPWGAVAGGAAGLLSGLIGSGRALPTVDMSSLLSTINSAGQYQRQLINSLPDEIKANLMEYSKSLGAAGSQYQSAIQGLTQDLQSKSASIYGPNSAAAGLAKDASKKDIYSTLPGTQNAIRNALAATGGLARGHAGQALAAPVLQAASDYSKSASGIDADQAKLSQGLQAQALQTATSMDAAMFQNMFGMTKEQATQILSSGNAALSSQLAQLIAQSNGQTGQILSAQGIEANNGYQNAVTRNAQQDSIYAGLTNMGVNGLTSLYQPMPGNTSTSPTTSGTTTSSAGPYADLQYA